MRSVIECFSGPTRLCNQSDMVQWKSNKNVHSCLLIIFFNHGTDTVLCCAVSTYQTVLVIVLNKLCFIVDVVLMMNFFQYPDFAIDSLIFWMST